MKVVLDKRLTREEKREMEIKENEKNKTFKGKRSKRDTCKLYQILYE